MNRYHRRPWLTLRGYQNDEWTLADRHLNQVAQILVRRTPHESLRTARLAMNELLAGEPFSMVERFNFPRRWCQVIAHDPRSLLRRVKGIERLLDRLGV